jgi:virginiamycin B lyase
MNKTKVRLHPTYYLCNIMLRIVVCCLVFSMILLLFFIPNQWIGAQPATPEEFVTYEKQSGFIKEFAVPFEELGLKGITTDLQGNVWFYHSTNATSTLVLFNPANGEFTKFPVEGETVSDEPIINLASSQLAFDTERNAVWFTDSRINSVGRLNIDTAEIRQWPVPTEQAGPMGLTLSPDGNSVWFAEITGDKIARLDVSSGKIEEYPTGEESGPALLAFDNSGQLWVTLSFADSVLLAQPWALAPNSSLGMSRFSLPEPDRFSPLGIAFSEGKVFLPDHGSSRIIVADANSNLQQYEEYWTSPSSAFPTTLPSQIVSDKQGKIYLTQHGGNRITEISKDGMMTEYEVATGPLSTVVYLSVAGDGKVWFAEWASNKIAYLDTAMQVPFTLNVEKTAVTLDGSSPQIIAVSLNSSSDTAASPVSLSEVEIGLTGMTESGLQGVAYEAQPPRVNLQDARSAQSEIQIRAQENARPGNYIAMVRAFAPEKDGLVISRLHPVELVLDVPEPVSSQDSNNMFQNQRQQASDTIVQDALMIGAPAGAAGLIAFAIYRWKKARKAERAH